MRLKKISILLCVLLLHLSAQAADEEAPAAAEPTPVTYRSNPDKHIWIAADLGLQAGSWGVNSGGGLGALSGASLRAQFGRCSGVFEWNHETMDYYQPDPISNLNVIGLGAACQVTRLGDDDFWQGSHLLVRGLIEYASNEYEIYDWKNRPVAFGTTYGWGGLVGLDMMIPIYVGFWGFAGSGIEALQFHYDIPDNSQGIHDVNHPTLNFFFRLGVAYAFW